MPVVTGVLGPTTGIVSVSVAATDVIAIMLGAAPVLPDTASVPDLVLTTTTPMVVVVA